MDTQMIEKIRTYLTTQPVRRAWIFGSYARGEETPDSDVDILVSYDRTQPIGLLRIGTMYADLQDLLGRQVDLVEEDRLKPYAAQSVQQDKILIYERTH